MIITESVVQRLTSAGTGSLSNELWRLGVGETTLCGLRSVTTDRPFAGPALTLRYLPYRGDLGQSPNGPLQREVVDDAPAGAVLVVDARGSTACSVMGDLVAQRARHRGLAGVVVDGAVRDVTAIRGIDLPVQARGSSPNPNRGHLVPWEVGGTVACADVLVNPEDVVVGDSDGVVVIPRAVVAEVLARVERSEAREAGVRAELSRGATLQAAYQDHS